MSSYTVNSVLQNLVQQGYLERLIRDAMLPEIKFRELAVAEQVGNVPATSITRSKAGIPGAYMVPRVSGDSVASGAFSSEMWSVDLADYARTLSLSLRDNAMTIGNLLVTYSKQQALEGALSAQGLAANALYEAAGWGYTFATSTDATGTATSLPVSSLDGFRFVHDGKQFVAVSAANPITAKTGSYTVTITAATPTDATKPNGAGTLTIAAGPNWAKGDVIISDQASAMATPGGKELNTLTSSDVLSVEMVLSAKSKMAGMGVPYFADGTYHLHLSSADFQMLLADTAMQNLMTGAINSQQAATGLVGRAFGVSFIINEGVPSGNNSQGSYGANGEVIPDFFKTVPASTPFGVSSPLLVGAGALNEYYKDIVNVVYPNNPVWSKVVNTNLVNARALPNGAVLGVENIYMHYAAPTDVLNDALKITWEFFGGFGITTDYNAAGGDYPYKRVVSLPYYIG